MVLASLATPTEVDDTDDDASADDAATTLTVVGPKVTAFLLLGAAIPGAAAAEDDGTEGKTGAITPTPETNKDEDGSLAMAKLRVATLPLPNGVNALGRKE